MNQNERKIRQVSTNIQRKRENEAYGFRQADDIGQFELHFALLLLPLTNFLLPDEKFPTIITGLRENYTVSDARSPTEI